MKKKPGTRRAREPVDLGMALVVAWKTSARVTEDLLDHLDATLWRAEPPGQKGRTIASSAQDEPAALMSSLWVSSSVGA